MTLNRYSKLPKATIRNTQVLTDLGIIDTAFQRKQRQYDTKAAQLGSAVQGAESMQFFGNAANAYKSKVVDDIKNKVSEISNLDLSDPNVTKGTEQYIQQVSQDPELQKHAQAKQYYDTQQEQFADLEKRGKLHGNQKLLQDLAWKQYSETGQISPELNQPLYEAQDLIAERGKLVNMIKSSGHEGTAFFNGIAYGNSSSGVSMDKISKAVRDQIGTYANSQAGRQEYNDWKAGQLTGAIPKGQTFENYLLGGIMSTAQNYAHSNTSNDYSSAFNKLEQRAYDEKKEAKKKEEEDYTGYGYTPATGGKDIEVDSDGMINVNPIFDAIQSVTGWEPRTKEELALQKSLQERASKAGMSVEQFAEQVNADPNVRVKYFSSKKADEVSKRFFNPTTKGGDFYTRKVYTSEYPEGISAKEFMEIKNLKPEDLKGITLIGEVDSDNPYTPKGYSALIGGEVVTVGDEYSLRGKEGVLAKHNFQKNQVKHNGGEPVTFEDTDPNTGKTYRFTYEYDGTTGGSKLVARDEVK